MMKAGFFMWFRALMQDEVAIRRAKMRVSHCMPKRSKEAQEDVSLAISRQVKPFAEVTLCSTSRVESVSSTCSKPEILDFRNNLTFKQKMPCVHFSAHLSYNSFTTSVFGKFVVSTCCTVWAAIDAVFFAGYLDPFCMHPNQKGLPGSIL